MKSPVQEGLALLSWLCWGLRELIGEPGVGSGGTRMAA